MIPEAAVEAAAKQMAVNDGDLIGWVLYQADAKRALEAALPHMLRESGAAVEAAHEISPTWVAAQRAYQCHACGFRISWDEPASHWTHGAVK